MPKKAARKPAKRAAKKAPAKKAPAKRRAPARRRGGAELPGALPPALPPVAGGAKAKKAKGARGRTKSDLYASIADKVGLKKTEVSAVLDRLEEEVQHDLKHGGIFVLPGLLKIVLVHRAARPAHEGMNPFTKTMMMFKAKPATDVVKIRAMKKLKEMA
jgi:nucleoid DNA-binding protein